MTETNVVALFIFFIGIFLLGLYFWGRPTRKALLREIEDEYYGEITAADFRYLSLNLYLLNDRSLQFLHRWVRKNKNKGFNALIEKIDFLLSEYQTGTVIHRYRPFYWR